MSILILGISSFTYGWAIGIEGSYPVNPMQEQGLIHNVLNFGLRCLQVGDNLPLHRLQEEQLHSFKTEILKKGIRLEIGARKLTADNLRRYIELAGYLHAPLLRFVIDDDQYKPDIQTVKSLIAEYLAELEKRRITLGIENHDRLKAKDFAYLMESIDSSSVGICLDCANSLGAGEGLQQVATLLAPHTVNLHIKDFIAKRLSHKMGFTITGIQAGKGLVDIPWLLEMVAPYGRCQSAVLEQWVTPADDLETTIEREKEWAIEGIKYLKTLSWFREG